jgi:regulatory protein
MITPDEQGGTVTRLAFLARDQSRVAVYVDRRRAVILDAVQAVELGLKRGRVLTAADLADLRRLGQREQAVAAALAQLAYRPRSRRELADWLAHKEVPPDIATGVLDDLARRGYIDDAAFARFWVENRQLNRPRGRLALAAELRAKGVASEVIDAALGSEETAGEEATALALARRRARSLRDPDPLRFRRRLGAFLQRKGYRYETVRTVLAALAEEQGHTDGDDPLDAPE